MTWERMQAYARDEGIQTGKIEAAENALKLGLSVEQVMQITGLPLEKILELQKQL